MTPDSATHAVAAQVEHLRVRAYEVPMEVTESDATLEWPSTTMIAVEAHADGERGLGYTYGDPSVATMVESKLSGVVRGADALRPGESWAAMQVAIRNAGRPGVGAMAISAVDTALWDLKARLLGVALVDLLPGFRDGVPVYGSGGFTSYDDDRLAEQLRGWVDQGIPRVKIKVGRDPAADPRRIRAAREAIGDGVDLLVDANGAYRPKEALLWAQRFADAGIVYLEEPVSSENTAGMALVRERGPAGLDIAAGEYSWNLTYSAGLLGAVDILQADVTRIGGITEMLRVDGLCKAHQVAFSAHCAPALSAHVGCAMETLVHLEYFHDHVRVEGLVLEGTLDPAGGVLTPDRTRPGHGLALRGDAERYLIHDTEAS